MPPTKIEQTKAAKMHQTGLGIMDMPQMGVERTVYIRPIVIFTVDFPGLKPVHDSSINAASPASRHSRDLDVNRLIPDILPAQSDSEGVLKVYPRCDEMTPMACSTAFLESRPNTAG